MRINDDYTDLSYNCGRLLAIADAIERWASNDKERTTNAVRYFTRFSKRPCETWSLINERLSIYKQQLGNKGNKLYSLIEISSRIDPEEFAAARNLDGRMCLGFDSQRQSIIRESIERSMENKNKDTNGGNDDGSIKE